MSIQEQLTRLADEYYQRKDTIPNEEGTKISLVLPFLDALGYNTHNCSEVFPEFITDVGIKRGEKVDLAIMDGKTPIILIEVKDCKKILDRNDLDQLFRYFSVTQAKIAILTNGSEYRFFADIDKKHVLDDEPFFIFRINNFQSEDVAVLEHFMKNSFDAKNIRAFAEELKYAKQIKDYFSKQLTNLSAEFTEFIAQNVFGKDYSGIDTEKIRNAIKKTLPQIIINSDIEIPLPEDTIKITLNDGPKKVTSHPLISFSFNGKTYKQDTYIQMLLDVIRLLDKFKPGVLETLLHAKDWPLSYKLSEHPDELHKPVKIKDNIFIERGISSSTVLIAIKKFFEEFALPQSMFYALISTSTYE